MKRAAIGLRAATILITVLLAASCGDRQRSVAEEKPSSSQATTPLTATQPEPQAPAQEQVQAPTAEESPDAATSPSERAASVSEPISEPENDRPGALDLTIQPSDVRVVVMGPERFMYLSVLSGDEHFESLRPGKYVVAGTKSGYRATFQDIDITGGQTAHVSLSLEQDDGSAPLGQR